jgi:hypothetical protein
VVSAVPVGSPIAKLIRATGAVAVAATVSPYWTARQRGAGAATSGRSCQPAFRLVPLASGWILYDWPCVRGRCFAVDVQVVGVTMTSKLPVPPRFAPAPAFVTEFQFPQPIKT